MKVCYPLFMKGHDSHRGHSEVRTIQGRRWKADDDRKWIVSLVMLVLMFSAVLRWYLRL